MRRLRELNQNEKPDRKSENEDPDWEKARRGHAVRGSGKIRGDTGIGTVLWELYKQKARLASPLLKEAQTVAKRFANHNKQNKPQ
jgi:hypothetical protein